MGTTPKRTKSVVVKTQFNINGSRGKDVGHFISDYVARDAATDPYTAYLPPIDRPMVRGDGVAFTLYQTAISKQDTLDLAAEVQTLFEEGNRAVEQLVITFSPDYLVEEGLVPDGLSMMERGDYKYNYDDVRLRHAIQAGVSAMLENDGYYNGNMVAAIQSDTLHLHVHAVVYERGDVFLRKHGKEERGMLKESSLNRLTYHIDRYLESTKDLSVVPTQRLLTPHLLSESKSDVFVPTEQDTSFVDKYLRLLEEQDRERALRGEVSEEEMDEMLTDVAGLDDQTKMDG